MNEPYFQTNAVVFVLICLAWLAVCAYIGAYKAFFQEPAEAEDKS